MNGQASTRICDNCGQPVLRSDVACWHCGARLALLAAEAPAESAEPQIEEEGEESHGTPRQIIFYAIMTAVTALALLFVIRSLGRQPRLGANMDLGEVVAIELAAPDGSFTIEVPEDIIWYFPQVGHGRNEAAAQLAGEGQFEQALQPLLSLTEDSQRLLIGQMENGILSIVRSQRLGGLAVDNVVASLGNESFPGSSVLSTRKSRNRQGSALASLTIEQLDPPQICRQHLLPDKQGAYLSAICTDPASFDQQSAEFEAILNSLTIRQ